MPDEKGHAHVLIALYHYAPGVRHNSRGNIRRTRVAHALTCVEGGGNPMFGFHHPRWQRQGQPVAPILTATSDGAPVVVLAVRVPAVGV
ncbi:hypothetical protein QF048_007058 [Streptomyces sp. W4I9-2]|nr:hypothetical protein [Streptomyces sp. W4I9-2]